MTQPARNLDCQSPGEPSDRRLADEKLVGFGIDRTNFPGGLPLESEYLGDRDLFRAERDEILTVACDARALHLTST
jgi:hypothetical protein